MAYCAAPLARLFMLLLAVSVSVSPMAAMRAVGGTPPRLARAAALERRESVRFRAADRAQAVLPGKMRRRPGVLAWLLLLAGVVLRRAADRNPKRPRGTTLRALRVRIND